MHRLEIVNKISESYFVLAKTFDIPEVYQFISLILPSTSVENVTDPIIHNEQHINVQSIGPS